MSFCCVNLFFPRDWAIFHFFGLGVRWQDLRNENDTSYYLFDSLRISLLKGALFEI